MPWGAPPGEQINVLQEKERQKRSQHRLHTTYLLLQHILERSIGRNSSVPPRHRDLAAVLLGRIALNVPAAIMPRCWRAGGRLGGAKIK